MSKKDRLIRPGMKVVDLGAAPGGWTQVAVQLVGEEGMVVASDILPMDSIADVTFVQGDFTEQAVYDQIVAALGGEKVDLVISDMAPNISGIKMVDQQKAIYLNELAFDFATKHLKQNGCFLVKSFVGKDFEEFVKNLRSCFNKVYKIKPDSSRSRSAEIFLLGYEFCSS
jgi:23S rRNA (uridine2552-2'-O)-methyltransferase